MTDATRRAVCDSVDGTILMAHMQELALRYDGEAWTPVEGQVRLLLVIRPDHVLGWT